MSKIKVSQKLSLIGKTKKQIACVKGLGLRRINDSRIVEDTPENLGMINTVRHMVEVEQLGEQKNAKWNKIKRGFKTL